MIDDTDDYDDAADGDDDGPLDRRCAVSYGGFADEVRQLHGARSAGYRARSKPSAQLDSACPQDEARRRQQYPGQQPVSTRKPDAQRRQRQ